MQDKLKKAKELLEIVGPYGLAEFEYSDEDVKIRFSREGATAPPTGQTAPVATAAPPPPAPRAAAAPAPSAPTAMAVEVSSPMVGTYYSAPTPDKPPYVSLGEIVEKGQVVCIIEAMKLMNEIKSPARGRITRILTENASPVAKDEVLFHVDPS